MIARNPTAGSDGRRRFRVLVVDDSAAQRMMLVALLNSDPELEVVGWAADGAEAVRAAAKLTPDVITMDLRMPVMDGLESSRRIMQETPTRIVMVTASASRATQKLAFDAYDAGVLAVLAKPTPGPAGEAAVRELLRTVKNMAQIRVIRRWAPSHVPGTQADAPASTAPTSRAIASPVATPKRTETASSLPEVRHVRRPEVVAIGASTGGPQALRDILAQLPSSFSLPVLVVQHIAVGFTSGLVDWLASHCALPVQVATPDQPLNGSGIYVAPAGQHLVVRRRSTILTTDPLVSGHRPSATVLFQSVAQCYRAAAIGVLLTGMGDDGAVGLRDLKRAGALTIAQDEESCVVFGMPAVAISLGIVDHVLSPAMIGALLVRLDERLRG